MTVTPIPPGFHTVTPYLMVRGAAQLIDFLKRAFEAQQLRCMTGPDGTIKNAEIRIGDSMVMVAEAPPSMVPPAQHLYLYVPDCDATYRQAVKAGGVSIQEPADMFYGDRHGGVTDPVGLTWWIATHKEDVSDAEVTRRAAAYAKPR